MGFSRARFRLWDLSVTAEEAMQSRTRRRTLHPEAGGYNLLVGREVKMEISGVLSFGIWYIVVFFCHGSAAVDRGVLLRAEPA